MSTFASVETANGLAGLRDLTPADLAAIVDYWTLSPVEFLTGMGADLRRFGSAEDIRARFANTIRTGGRDQSRIALAITLGGAGKAPVPVQEDGAGKAPVPVQEDGAGKAPVPVLEDRAGKAPDRLVGYTLLNHYSDDVNYSHWHIIVPGLRAKGLSTALYPYRIQAYFDLAPIAQLIHQTRTTNVGVNRLLDKFIPIAETKYIEAPDGFAAPGEFHLRYVRRQDIPGLFSRAAQLHKTLSP